MVAVEYSAAWVIYNKLAMQQKLYAPFFQE